MMNDFGDFLKGLLLGGLIGIMLAVNFLLPYQTDFDNAVGYCYALGYNSVEIVVDTHYCIDTTGTLLTIEAKFP